LYRPIVLFGVAIRQFRFEVKATLTRRLPVALCSDETLFLGLLMPLFIAQYLIFAHWSNVCSRSVKFLVGWVAQIM